MALQMLEGFEEKMKNTVIRSTELFIMLNQIPGVKISPVKNGTNIFMLALDAKIDAQKFAKTMLEKYNIFIQSKREDGLIRLMVNETLLYKDNSVIVAAFKDSIKEATS